MARLPRFVRSLLDGLEDVELSATEMLLVALSLGFTAWYSAQRHWVANNAIALCLCVQAIEMISLGSVQVGFILLGGLFFYDIFFVFYTPIMVTVATSFDAPIKLLFVRFLEADTQLPKFSMLGLGDIVIPGFYLALLLRMDHSRKFETAYFKCGMLAYCLGLVATLVLMQVFQHAQPALLYLVPACLGSTLLVAAVRGEIGRVFAFSEEEPAEDAQTKSKST